MEEWTGAEELHPCPKASGLPEIRHPGGVAAPVFLEVVFEVQKAHRDLYPPADIAVFRKWD